MSMARARAGAAVTQRSRERDLAILRVHQIFKAVSPLPPMLLAAALWEISRTEGWGGWGLAAAVGPILIGFSFVMGLVGVTLWIVEWRKGKHAASLLVATALAASPCLWFLLRVAYLELTRGP